MIEFGGPDKAHYPDLFTGLTLVSLWHAGVTVSQYIGIVDFLDGNICRTESFDITYHD